MRVLVLDPTDAAFGFLCYHDQDYVVLGDLVSKTAR